MQSKSIWPGVGWVHAVRTILIMRTEMQPFTGRKGERDNCTECRLDWESAEPWLLGVLCSP